MTVVRSPLAGLGATMDNRKTPCAHSNSSASLTTLGGHITSLSKYTCFSKNVVYAINCRTCNKMYIEETGRRLGDRLRVARTFTLYAITWHRPPRWLPLYIPWSQRRRHVSIDDPFWISKSNRKGQFWGQNDIRIPDTSTSRTESGLQLYLNFSTSARAYNVSLCFGFYLNVTLRVLFSVALNHRGRGSTLERSGFFVPFPRTFW